MGDTFEERFLEFLSIINITDDDYRKNIADFAFKRSEEYIKSYCNIDNLPKELFGVHKNIAIDFNGALLICFILFIIVFLPITINLSFFQFNITILHLINNISFSGNT